MEWEWSKFDDRGLARYVIKDAANLVRLPLNRHDLALDVDGRRQVVEAIYHALVKANKKVRYAPEKYNPSAARQTIRTPTQILDAPGEGTCLDLALLFCGLCLGYELLPLLIVVEGHALAAVSLNHGLGEWDALGRREQELFRENPLTDADKLCELVDDGDYLAIECTGFAQSKSLPESVPEGYGRENGFLPFNRAIAAGRKQLSQPERPLKFALDIAVSHYSWGIEPVKIPDRTDTSHQIDQQARDSAIQLGHIGQVGTLNINTASRPPAGVPFQAPPLPTSFVERPEVSEELKKRLLAEATARSGVLVVSAIHGLGGIGKSTLAAALAYDKEVQNHFVNGVLWATLGQQPDLLSLLSSWMQALGDSDFKPTTTNAASAHLRTLLHDKAVLLVVDDVWNPDDVKPFCVGTGNSRLLITTRRADVADEVGAQLYELDVMSPEQSLTLLSTRLGRTLEGKEREEAGLLAKAVGYLPIALELVAARVGRGISWAELRKALDEEVARLEKLEGPRRGKGETRLEASFNLSLNALRDENEEVWQNFVWLGVLPEDAAVAAPMAATLWKVEEEEAAERLELLWNDALLLLSVDIWVGEGSWRTYRLHDLLHDVARRLLTTKQPQGFGKTLPEAHTALLENYQSRIQNNQWHTLSDDGYIHARLTWHMEKAGWVDEIHKLLREETTEGRNGWFEACDRPGQTASYVTDIARAWQLAEAAFANDPSLAIGLQCRYALVNASLNSLAANIPAALMAALVEKKVWTAAKGLAYTRQLQDGQQAQALSKLAPHLPRELLPQALEAARAIGDEYDLAQALSDLAPHLPQQLLPQAFEAARAIRNEEYLAQALSKLAPHLPQQLLPHALEAARAIRNEYYRAQVLSNLAPHLPQQLLPQALEAARAIPSEYNRAQALSHLAPHLAKLLPTSLYPLWCHTLHILARRRRRDLLSDIRELAPVIIALGHPQTVAEIARAIQDVGRQWP